MYSSPDWEQPGRLTQASQFGVAAITLGYANFIIVPLANCFGRRPIIAICGIICILANVW
jgi:hypothetical protein